MKKIYFYTNDNQLLVPIFNPISIKKNSRIALLALLTCFCFFNGYGQTTIINPTTEGGFESGITFAANGWTATTGSTNPLNHWVCETGATTGYTGSRCAYITRNSSNIHEYNISNSRTSHLYRNITIPSGQTDITLPFNWLCQGESTYDRMRIWIVPTSYSPIYGTEITTTGIAPTGRIPVGATNYSGQATWTSTTFKLPSDYAGSTARLIFEWTNDNSLGTNPPAAIDNINLTSQSPVAYCASVPNTGFADGLTSVQFNTINDAVASVAAIPYTDNTSLNTNVTRGQTYSINVSANTDGNYEQFQTVWFDWNKDGDFDDSGETYQLGSVTNNPSGLSSACPLTITIPLTATLGQTRMRVAARYALAAAPCDIDYDGEVRDYSVTVTGAVSYCSPTSDVPNGLYISSMAFLGALTDPPVNTSTFSATGYQNFNTLPTKAVQAQGEGINITARTAGNNIIRGRWKAWVDWNKDGVFQPATEEIYNTGGYVGDAATFGFIIPIAAPPGDYRLRIMVNNSLNAGVEGFGYDFLPCDNFSTAGTRKYYGETEDYLFTVVAKCNSLITAVTNGANCGSGTINLGAVATAGVTEFRWYTTLNGGTYSTSSVSGTATTFTTPTISTTTNYYVTAFNGSCESQVRTLVVAKVNPAPVVAFTPSAPVVCGENTIIQLTANADKEVVYLIDEDFEGGGLGLFSNSNNDANNATIDGITSWKNQTSTFVPSTSTWFPAISSGFGTNKFALAYSESTPLPTNTVENSISLTNVINSNNFLNLTLKLKMYYSRYISDGYIDPAVDEYVSIELSTDGGTSYPNIIESIVRDIGIGTRFAELSYDLSAYINQPNLKIRVRLDCPQKVRH